MSVQVQNLSLKNGNQAIFTNLNFTVANGEMTALYGPTGGGKTSLLLVLAGLIKPSSGQILLDGQALSTTPALMRCRVGLGVVPEFSSFAAKITLGENLLLLAQSLKVKPAKARVEAVLDDLQLQKYARTYAGDLPANIVAKASLAVALLNEPANLLLDEPLHRLISEEGEEIRQLLLALKQQGKCIIISTRDQKLAATCDKTLIIPGGKVVANDESNAVTWPGAKTALA